MTFQRTLRRTVYCAGIGLHSGHKVTLTLKPAPADTGLVFRRTDLGGFEIPAHVSHVASISYATVLARGNAKVETVEHLLSALVSQGIDNAYIELNQSEVPIMDGSAAPFVYLIREDAGIKKLGVPRRYLRVTRPLSLSHGDKQISLYPADELKVSYTINFDHPLLRHQTRSISLTEESFIEEIAPARTFGFLKDVEALRQKGLALGGSLDNAIVLGETGVLNTAPLRGRVRPPQDSRRDRRPGPRRPPDHRPHRRPPRRPRTSHRVCGADFGAARRVGTRRIAACSARWVARGRRRRARCGLTRRAPHPLPPSPRVKSTGERGICFFAVTKLQPVSPVTPTFRLTPTSLRPTDRL